MGNIIVKFRLSVFSKTIYFSNKVFGIALNATLSTLFHMVWLSLMAIMTPLAASADQANISPTSSGTDWVVVIRNTTSMKRAQRNALVNTLPKLLFQKSVSDSGTRLKLPVFNPDHDHLSLVFASIHKSSSYWSTEGNYPKECKNFFKERDRSAKLDHFFITREPYKSVRSEQELTNLLNKWVIKDPCLFKGLDFNEYIAENAVVPYLRGMKPQSADTKNTIIVLVNNTKGSISMDKSNQIKEFEDSYRAARNFRADYITVNPADWVFTVFADYKIKDNEINMGLGLGSGKKEILIRYMITKITYLPNGFKSDVVKFEKELKEEVDRLEVKPGETTKKPAVNTSIRQCFGLKEYMCIAVSILIAAAFIGLLLMYYYMRSKNSILQSKNSILRSKNSICIPELNQRLNCDITDKGGKNE